MWTSPNAQPTRLRRIMLYPTVTCRASESHESASRWRSTVSGVGWASSHGRDLGPQEALDETDDLLWVLTRQRV